MADINIIISTPAPRSRRRVHTGKQMVFEATRPLIVDARHTPKSYIALLELIREFGNKDPESVVELVIRNEKGILKDVVSWCESVGDELLGSEVGSDGELRCLIQKGMPVKEREQRVMSVVIGNVGLENLVPVFEKAIGGVLLGMEVNVIFEGVGVKLLRRGYRSFLSGTFGKWLTGVTESVLKDEMGGLLPREAIEILDELGARFWVDETSMKTYGRGDDEFLIKQFAFCGVVTLVDLLARSDVKLYSKSEFRRP